MCRFDGTTFTRYVIPGIQGDTIPSLTFDSEGTLWCSHFGDEVFYLDGTDWGSLPGPSGSWSVAVDQDNAVWFGCWDYIARYDGVRWTYWNDILGEEARFGKGAAVDSRGHVWFGARGGVFEYDGQAWVVHDNGIVDTINTINDVAAGSDGTIWVAGDNGVAVFENDMWGLLETSNSGLISDAIRDIHISPENDVWIATAQAVSCFSGGSWFSYTAENSSLPVGDLRAVAVDRDGMLWVGTWGGGVLSYDGREWKQYTTADGLSDNHVVAIATAADNAKWFGTYYGGVTRYADFATAVEGAVLTAATDPRFLLHYNSPNPFNMRTSIAYQLNRNDRVTLTVYDILGQRVMRLVDQWQAAGSYRTSWDGTDERGRSVGSGVYLYRLEAGDQAQTRRLMLLQ